MSKSVEFTFWGSFCTALAVLLMNTIPVQYDCCVCGEVCHTESLLASTATADTTFAHALCSGWGEPDPADLEAYRELLNGKTTTVEFNTVPKCLQRWAK